MNKKEKLLTVLGGGRIEGYLSGYWYHFPPDCRCGKTSVEAHKAFYEATDADILKLMNEHLYRFDTTIESPSDWRKLTPIRAKTSFYADYLEEIRLLRRALGDGVPLFATIHGLLVSACHATDGPNRFTDPDNTVTRHLKADPDAVFTGLSAIADSLDDLCAACIEAGADGIYYAALGGEEHRFDETLFLDYVRPLERRILGNARRRGLVILHICKDHVRLPAYADYPADIVNWAVHDCRYSLTDGRRIFPAATLLGGFDDRSGVLVDGSEQEVRTAMERIAGQMGRERFLFGADCTLPTEIGYARIRSAIEMAHTL